MRLLYFLLKFYYSETNAFVNCQQPQTANVIVGITSGKVLINYPLEARPDLALNFEEAIIEIIRCLSYLNALKYFE